MPIDTVPSPEREQTDESLRAERKLSDDALGDAQSEVDQTADDVISRARARADELLAAARASTDGRSPSSAPGAQLPAMLQKQREGEDRVLREERASADEVLRVERAEHVAVLESERDETDKDLLSERERADKAVATRDEFLGIVSHDLRNLLNTIALYTKLISDDVLKSEHVEQVSSHAQRIDRANVRMNRLIGDLIDIASIEAGALTVVRELLDPTQVATEAVQNLQTHASASGISLQTDIVGPQVLASFDPARVLQVLINLLSNAIKFTPASGLVTLRVERVGEDLRFAVSDTGQGIPSDKLETVFERFVQVGNDDRRGVGLGLYICKCIVQGHGGRIWAESAEGEGSTICFTLPLVA
jgi:signal transduction histidine kinase